MSDIFDYLTWRGDMDFSADPINCVDALIFSRISYFPFDAIRENMDGSALTISEAWKLLNTKYGKMSESDFLAADDLRLFSALSKSRRFGNLSLRNYKNIYNKQAQEQFAAVTIECGKWSFIAYRGTDDTLVGWKEDFNMGFSSPVPSQAEAVRYLEESASYSNDLPLYVGGHSKGGNLAVYAALFCTADVQSRIAAVYNNDGPGFDRDVISGAAFRTLKDRIFTFVPQSSVVGMLLEHEENYIVIHSTQTGILQHDLYSWEVLGKDFIRLSSTTNGSRFVDRTLKDWVAQMSFEQRSSFFDSLYDIVSSTNAESFSELKEDWFKNSKIIINSLMNKDEETKKIIIKTILQLIRTTKNNLSEFSPAGKEKMLPDEI